jgi:hypothetical protein
MVHDVEHAALQLADVKLGAVEKHADGALIDFAVGVCAIEA